MNTGMLSLCMVLALCACADRAEESVQDFVAHAGAGMRGDVRPLPPSSRYEPVLYTGAKSRDPFDPGRATPALPKPDARHREPLEAYGLETLRLIGMLERNGTRIALVRSPDGLVHQVLHGNYLGLNSGRVTRVGESEIVLVEALADGEGRVATLALAVRN